MSVVAFSTRRPVTVFIFALAAVVFGAVAFRDLAVDLLPDITYPSLTVETEYLGAAPTEIEALITRPIENAVGVVNNVVRVTSSSRSDTSEVTLEFAWGTDMDFASLDVRERLDMVRLPVDAEKPVLLRFDPSLDPVLRIGLTGDDDLVRLRLVAEEEVKRALERVEGVAAAIVSGGLEEEIQVEIDEKKVTALGLTIEQVVNRLAQENVNLTGGRLQHGQTEYLVRTVNEFLRPEDMRDVVVQRTGAAIIRLSDIARVFKGAKEREIITRIDGLESVELAIYKEGGGNTVTVVDSVQSVISDLEERLSKIDPNLRLTTITDQARYIRESVRAVIETAVMGGGLAVIVLFLFLRSLRNTLIIGISIPVSVMATFFLMYVFDVSLNIMSLGGLTLGIGLLLDNSIVVLEAIQRKRETGLALAEAAREGASEVARAVTASTITTVCVFVPIVFVEGIAGQLFGDQALTVTFSLIVSLGVALTVIPMLASREFSTAKDELESAPEAQGAIILAPVRWLQKGLFLVALGVARVVKGVAGLLATLGGLVTSPVLVLFDKALVSIQAIYTRALRGVLSRPVLTILATIGVLALTVPLVGGLGRELVPELIQGEFFLDGELTPGTRLEVTDRRLESIERYASQLPGVRTVYTVVGGSNEQGGSAGETRENIGQVTVLLEPPPDPEREIEAIEQIRDYVDQENARVAGPQTPAGLSQAPALGERSRALEYRFGRPSYFSFRTPVEVEIRGNNLELLARIGDQLAAQMRQIPGLVDVKASTEGGNPELQIIFDRNRMADLGYTIGDIGGSIRARIQGEVPTDIVREDRNIDIRLRADERYRDSIKDLRNLNIARTGSVPIPLSAVADVVETEGPAEIRRTDGSRVTRITANLVGRDLGTVATEIEGLLANLNLPLGYESTIGGQRQEMETSFDSLRTAILLAVFMVYLVMASQFESLLHPFVILFSVPFSVIGAILALVGTATTVSIVVLIGGILLAGIVVNNAIILVDTTNRLRTGGASKIDALMEAGRLRLRPILMTTATTVLGLAPMAAGLGEGSELRAPLAITVIGGLLTSTMLTLLIIPAVYSLIDRRA